MPSSPSWRSFYATICCSPAGLSGWCSGCAPSHSKGCLLSAVPSPTVTARASLFFAAALCGWWAICCWPLATACPSSLPERASPGLAARSFPPPLRPYWQKPEPEARHKANAAAPSGSPCLRCAANWGQCSARWRAPYSQVWAFVRWPWQVQRSLWWR